MAGLVFTNGVFDVLHSGHTKLLWYARSLGSMLIVGINSDASARRLKGPGRPLNDASERMAVLRAVKGVDAVEIFDEDTPEALMLHLRPDILVKGPEAALAPIPGSQLVQRVEVPSWAIERSTTVLIDKILSRPPGRLCSVSIDNRIVVPDRSTSISFVSTDRGAEPYLNHGHHREIKPWAVDLRWAEEADSNGRSA